MSEKLVKGANPLVSIVIPVYNTEVFLENTVESVLQQTYDNKQIILVDDGSPDNSPAICNNLAEKYNCVTTIHKENGGLSSARNAGIEKATGKYILFLDSDDTLEVCTIEDMVKIAEDKDSDAVIPNSYYKVYDNGIPSEIAYHFTEDMFKENAQDYALEILIGKARGQRSTAVLFKLDILKNNSITFPVGRVSEDFFFMLDFMVVANRLSVYTKPSLLNLKRIGSISAHFQKGFEENIWQMDEEVNKYLEKVGREDKRAKELANALLCRNVVTYLFSIMSAINPMAYKEKKKLAKQILFHEKTRGVWKKTQPIPYFQSKATMLVYAVVYSLLQLRFINLALRIMSFVKKKGR